MRSWCRCVLGVIMSATFFVSPYAQAGALISAGTELLFEYGPNGRTFETRQPYSLRGGYRADWGDLYLEYTSFQSSQGVPMVQVGRTHSEWALWYRRMFDVGWKFLPYGAAGAGAQYDNVETTFSGATTRSVGNPQALFVAAIGFSANLYERLEMQLEARLGVSSNYSPNPVPGFGLHLGWHF